MNTTGKMTLDSVIQSRWADIVDTLRVKRYHTILIKSIILPKNMQVIKDGIVSIWPIKVSPNSKTSPDVKAQTNYGRF